MPNETQDLFQKAIKERGIDISATSSKEEIFEKTALSQGATPEEIAPFLEFAKKQRVLETPIEIGTGVPTGFNPSFGTPLKQGEGLEGGKAAPGIKITQRFGAFNPRVEVFSKGYNRGVDVGLPVGSRLKAPKGNWIVREVFSRANPTGGFIGNSVNNGYGNSLVLVSPTTGEQVRFSHLSSVGNLRPGQTVNGGQVVALSGDSGSSSGSHTDFEYVVGGKLKDFSSKLKEVLF